MPLLVYNWTRRRKFVPALSRGYKTCCERSASGAPTGKKAGVKTPGAAALTWGRHDDAFDVRIDVK